MAFIGVFPVYKFKFKIGTKGRASTAPAEMKEIKELEQCGISIDGNVDEWTNMDQEGWGSALMTGKKFSLEMKGKRCVGDPGNDYVAETAWKDGLNCSTKAELEFIDGAKLAFNCILNVTNVGGGDSTSTAPLEFTVVGDGKPTYTAGTSAPA